MVRQRGETGVEQLGRDLRRVHADQERGLADVGERRGEPLGEAVAALGDDLEALGQPRAGLAVEHDDPPPGALGGQRGGERVAQRGAREVRRLLRRAGRAEPGLDLPGDRRLGDHEQSRAHS